MGMELRFWGSLVVYIIQNMGDFFSLRVGEGYERWLGNKPAHLWWYWALVG